MKKLFIVMTFLTGVAFAQSDSTKYPITATVEGARIVIRCDEVRGGTSQCNPYMHVTALINGHHYELEGGKARQGILMLGDYKAKLVKDDHKKPYYFQQSYELQYPDSSTEIFSVVGESR